jgi:predicted enzyme related to lactoylglutathione lyase
MNEETKLFTPNAANLCLVGCRPADGTIVINGLGGAVLPRADALNLAGWIVALTDPKGNDFAAQLETIQNT